MLSIPIFLLVVVIIRSKFYYENFLAVQNIPSWLDSASKNSNICLIKFFFSFLLFCKQEADFFPFFPFLSVFFVVVVLLLFFVNKKWSLIFSLLYVRGNFCSSVLLLFIYSSYSPFRFIILLLDSCFAFILVFITL